MAGVLAIGTFVIFVAGAIIGAGLLVSLASLREDRRRLSERAPDRIALAGRLVTGLRIQEPDPPGSPRHTRVDGHLTASRSAAADRADDPF